MNEVTKYIQNVYLGAGCLLIMMYSILGGENAKEAYSILEKWRTTFKGSIDCHGNYLRV